MTEPLDNILSRDGAAVPGQEQNATAAPETTPQTPPDQPGQQEPQSSKPDGQAMVPKAALDEARGKAKRYTEQVESFERQLREQNTAWEQRFNSLAQHLQPQKPQEPPDFYADPNAAVQQYLSPLEQRQRQLEQHFVQREAQFTETLSRRFAEQAHGKDKVETAYEALRERLALDPASRADYQHIMSTSDPWGELVRWHELQTEGPRRGESIADYKQRVIAEHEAQRDGQPPQGAQQQPRASVMPSNLAGARSVGSRSGPSWTGPRRLEDIFKRA